MQVVTVAVPRPLRRLFDYAVGDDGVPSAPGCRVRVPFGGADVVGVVVGHAEGSEHDLKPIGEVLDETPLLTPDLIELADWLARYYHHPIGGAYATLLPKLARRGAPARATRVLTWQPTVEAPPAALARAPAQRRALAMLIEHGGVDDADVAALGVPRRVLNALDGRGLVRGVPLEPTYCVAPGGIELTDEQRSAVAAIDASRGTAAVHLLQGVTGSGKTEVYMRAIERVLEAGQQALVLVPEIALTPQTTRRFRARFGAAATLHSGATDRQRFDAWIDCLSGRHRILIGTRSAVLAPLCNLGIIVVDEEHDPSYKQTEGLTYSARDVAVKRGQLLGIPVVLGSATPCLETLENVRRRRYGVLRLRERPVGGAPAPLLGARCPGSRAARGAGGSVAQEDGPPLGGGRTGSGVRQPSWLRAGAGLRRLWLAGAVRALRCTAYDASLAGGEWFCAGVDGLPSLRGTLSPASRLPRLRWGAVAACGRRYAEGGGCVGGAVSGGAALSHRSRHDASHRPPRRRSRRDPRRRCGHPGWHADACQGAPPAGRDAGGGGGCRCGFPVGGLPGRPNARRN